MELNDKIKQLPIDVQNFLLSDFGVDIQLAMSEEYLLSIDKLQQLTDIMTAAFVGDIKLDEIYRELAQKIELEDEEARALAIELLGKRFLVVDSYFNGQVVNSIKALGGDPSGFDSFVAEFKQAVAKETAPPVEEPDIVSRDKEETAEPYEPFKNPEEERREMLDVMKNYVLSALTSENLMMRLDVNAIIIALLATDHGFQSELLTALTNNLEKIGDGKIMVKGESMDSTVGNWLKDFMAVAQIDESQTVSTLAKAKYLSENKNIKTLGDEDRKVLLLLFELYDNIRNFYVNQNRMELSDIQILPYTDDELRVFEQAQHQAAGELTEKKVEAKTDVYDLYMGSEEDRSALKAAQETLVTKTKKDAVQVSNWMYDEIVLRHRINVIAGLLLSVETGVLDDYVATDRRYVELLEAHYKRNNMQAELIDYQKNRRASAHVKNFIKYVLMERLGMNENSAARVGLQLGNIYRSQGIKELAQIAYLDMNSKQIKWL
jgi:uncharacterized protein (DUF1330 family)